MLTRPRLHAAGEQLDEFVNDLGLTVLHVVAAAGHNAAVTRLLAKQKIEARHILPQPPHPPTPQIWNQQFS